MIEKKWRRLENPSFFLAVAMLFTFAKEGTPSQVFLQDINLEGLVNLSDVVAEVEKMSPDITFKDVPVDTTGKFPPYKRRQYCFDVVKVLVNRSDVKELKGPIVVMEANDDDQYQAIRNHHLGLPPESPVYFSYKSSVRYDQISGRFIVFLKVRPDGQFELSVLSAFESIKKRTAVSRLIAKRSESRISPPGR
jgi:hypothetical protein